MDDTFVIQKEDQNQHFLEHINSVNPTIRFTVKDNKEIGTIPFLDTMVKPEADNALPIAVYRKPTHTGQYLQWDSHHHLLAKYNVINTLAHSTKSVCNKPELLQKELDHFRKTLNHCKYSKWAMDKVEQLTSKESNNANN